MLTYDELRVAALDLPGDRSAQLVAEHRADARRATRASRRRRRSGRCPRARRRRAR